LDHVYLVVDGTTQAHILGRHLTAASTTPETRGTRQAGGDSGAWIGEMAFLDSFWENEQGKRNEDGESNRRLGTAIYTIMALEDCIVLRWSHEDLEDLMRSSSDIRAALTRSLSSALVGKVVNMTISRTNQGLPNWSTWLADWKNNDGAQVQVQALQRLPEEQSPPEDNKKTSRLISRT
jgi:hypothetical protein